MQQKKSNFRYYNSLTWIKKYQYLTNENSTQVSNS